MTFPTQNPFKYPIFTGKHYFMQKHLNILKNTLHRPHKDTLCTDVSNNKKVILKMYFCLPPNFQSPFYTTYTQQTDFLFGPNVAPKGLQTISFRFFHSLFTPQELKIRGLSSNSIQTYRQMHRCK